MIAIVRGSFQEYFFTRDYLLDFGELVNLLMLRNYVTVVRPILCFTVCTLYCLNVFILVSASST